MNPVDEYLDACGVVPICIIKLDEGFSYSMGRKKVHLPDVVNIHWVTNQTQAIQITRAARSHGLQTDKAMAERVLQTAASSYGVQLTTNVVVMTRATIATTRLREIIEMLDQTGMLRDFKKAYRLHRLAATARGDGFMTYKTAMQRFRRAMIMLLIEKRPVDEVKPIFDHVLDGRDLRPQMVYR